VTFLNSFYSFVTAMFAALIMVPFLHRWALDRGDLDHPDERSQHEAPTPRLGGVAIFLAFLFSSIIFVPINDSVRGLLAGVLIIFATGVMDDLSGISARQKFFGEAAACLVTIVVGKLYLTNLGNLFGFGDIVLPVWLGILFTLFAVVGMINAINLIDGLDGLAGGVSAVALTAFLILANLDHQRSTMLLAAAGIGAILGFLKYNFYPARIFMGDTGSLVLGFLLGFMAVQLTQHPGATVSPMVPVLVLGLPILDTVWVMTRRVLMGLSPFIADRSHVHHKFLDLGLEHRSTVIVIYGISAIWACLAIVLRSAPEYLLLILYLLSFLCFYIVLRQMLHHPNRFRFLRRDTNIEIRSSVTYQRISQKVETLVSAIKYLLAGYLLLATWSVITHSSLSWKVALPLLLLGAYLCWRPLSEERQFLLLIVYCAAGMGAVEVWHTDSPLLGGFTVKDCGDTLLGVASLIAILKIQFRKFGEFFFSSADFLALGICILIMVATQQKIFDVNMYGALFRAILALLAIRCIAFRSRMEQNLVVGGALGFLGLVVIVGILRMF
jgi:UDP-GlcNAc:undecaprenyl-phosphate GlcNAc-1-phosphate transferase